jgi:competence protein ComFC
VTVVADALSNEGSEELKGITDPIARNELLEAALKLHAPNNKYAGKKILLVDDLYRSGSTLRVATDLFNKQGKAAQVSVLTMTKTRSNR